MHLAGCAPAALFWKWMQFLYFFPPIIQVSMEKHVGCIFEQLCLISEPSFTFCYQLHFCSCLPQLCWGPSFNPTFPLQLPSLVQLVIDFLLSLYTNQLFQISDPLRIFLNQESRKRPCGFLSNQNFISSSNPSRNTTRYTILVCSSNIY